MSAFSVPPIGWIDSSYVKQVAAPNSFSRGMAITGDVSWIKYDGFGTYTAEVYGSSTYTVQIIAVDDELVCSNCSCPDRRAGFCKHTCAVLYHLLPDSTRSSPARKRMSVSPVKTTINSQPTSVYNAAVNKVAQSIGDELKKEASLFSSSSDVSHLAKIACIIYRQANEAVGIVKRTPLVALDIITNLIDFCRFNKTLFNAKHVQLSSSLEVVALAAVEVFLFNRNNHAHLSNIRSQIGHQYWNSPRANILWKDATHVLDRITKEINCTGTHSLGRLSTDRDL